MGADGGTRKAGGYLVRIRCMIRLGFRSLNPEPVVLGKEAACDTELVSSLPAFVLTLCEVCSREVGAVSFRAALRAFPAGTPAAFMRAGQLQPQLVVSAVDATRRTTLRRRLEWRAIFLQPSGLETKVRKTPILGHVHLREELVFCPRMLKTKKASSSTDQLPIVVAAPNHVDATWTSLQHFAERQARTAQVSVLEVRVHKKLNTV